MNLDKFGGYDLPSRHRILLFIYTSPPPPPRSGIEFQIGAYFSRRAAGELLTTFLHF
jgi:hypothetical protein